VRVSSVSRAMVASSGRRASSVSSAWQRLVELALGDCGAGMAEEEAARLEEADLPGERARHVERPRRLGLGIRGCDRRRGRLVREEIELSRGAHGDPLALRYVVPPVRSEVTP
jgi:hypothetical protein